MSSSGRWLSPVKVQVKLLIIAIGSAMTVNGISYVSWKRLLCVFGDLSTVELNGDYSELSVGARIDTASNCHLGSDLLV
jgi:hypothetical protein